MEDAQFSYGDFVKYLYEKGFHVERYHIYLMSYEVICDYNKIVIVPTSEPGEETIYIFTGTLQKIKTLGEPTEFRLSLFDISNNEFKDDDNIMLSVVKIDEKGENIHNLYTRRYAEWKFGVKFEKGIKLDSEKYLIFQGQKEIGKFDIYVRNIDLFRHKNKVDILDNRMMWLD